MKNIIMYKVQKEPILGNGSEQHLHTKTWEYDCDTSKLLKIINGKILYHIADNYELVTNEKGEKYYVNLYGVDNYNNIKVLYKRFDNITFIIISHVVKLASSIDIPPLLVENILPNRYACYIDVKKEYLKTEDILAYVPIELEELNCYELNRNAYGYKNCEKGGERGVFDLFTLLVDNYEYIIPLISDQYLIEGTIKFVQGKIKDNRFVEEKEYTSAETLEIFIRKYQRISDDKPTKCHLLAKRLMDLINNNYLIISDDLGAHCNEIIFLVDNQGDDVLSEWEENLFLKALKYIQEKEGTLNLKSEDINIDTFNTKDIIEEISENSSDDNGMEFE